MPGSNVFAQMFRGIGEPVISKSPTTVNVKPPATKSFEAQISQILENVKTETNVQGIEPVASQVSEQCREENSFVASDADDSAIVPIASKSSPKAIVNQFSGMFARVPDPVNKNQNNSCETTPKRIEKIETETRSSGIESNMVAVPNIPEQSKDEVCFTDSNAGDSVLVPKVSTSSRKAIVNKFGGMFASVPATVNEKQANSWENTPQIPARIETPTNCSGLNKIPVTNVPEKNANENSFFTSEVADSARSNHPENGRVIENDLSWTGSSAVESIAWEKKPTSRSVFSPKNQGGSSHSSNRSALELQEISRSSLGKISRFHDYFNGNSKPHQRQVSVSSDFLEKPSQNNTNSMNHNFTEKSSSSMNCSATNESPKNFNWFGTPESTFKGSVPNLDSSLDFSLPNDTLESVDSAENETIQSEMNLSTVCNTSNILEVVSNVDSSMDCDDVSNNNFERTENTPASKTTTTNQQAILTQPSHSTSAIPTNYNNFSDNQVAQYSQASSSKPQNIEATSEKLPSICSNKTSAGTKKSFKVVVKRTEVNKIISKNGEKECFSEVIHKFDICDLLGFDPQTIDEVYIE